MSFVRGAAIRRTAVFLACIALTSCAHEGKPRPAGMLELQTISINPDVVMPDSVSYMSAGQLWGQSAGSTIGGVAGAVVGSAIASADTPQVAIKSRLDENHIDVGAITVDELRKALGKQGRFKVVDQDSADAIASIEIKEYGFKVAGPFRTNMHVLIRAVVTVTGKDGKVLYHRNVGGHNTEATTFSMDEFLATPSNMDKAFRETAALMGNTTAKSMAGRPVPTEMPAEPAQANPADATPPAPPPVAPPATPAAASSTP